jgi:hypothetical protein
LILPAARLRAGRDQPNVSQSGQARAGFPATDNPDSELFPGTTDFGLSTRMQLNSTTIWRI